MRISDWSSDVCSSDLLAAGRGRAVAVLSVDDAYLEHDQRARLAREVHPLLATRGPPGTHDVALACRTLDALRAGRSEEHTSELQSLMRISYAVFCLKKTRSHTKRH